MIPLHNHSQFSALDGYGTSDEIAARVLELGMSSVAITDHGTTAGFVSHQKACKAAGLQPVYGMEAYHARKHRKDRPEKKNARDQAHLILLAENYTGYQNLMRLSDEAGRSGFYHVPRVDWDLLEKYKEGIVATSACMGGLVIQGILEETDEYFNKYLNLFKEKFFIEIHTYDSDDQRALNLELWRMAKQRGVPVVIANDAHYPSPDEYEKHEILMAIQFNKQVDLSKPLHPQCLYIMGEDEVRSRLSYLPDTCVDQAVKNTDVIAEMCAFTLPDQRMHLPKFPSKQNNDLLLIDRVYTGLRARYGDITDAIDERAAYELDAIIEAGLADYFLIVEDFSKWCGKQGIMRGPARGSVGGSVMAYALGITEIDPIRYNLFFERFWNPGRTAGLPDIDVDFEVARRDDVKEYLGQKYGENRVLSIGAYATMGPKAAVRRVAKALYGSTTSYEDLSAISKLLERTTDAGITADWQAIYEMVGEDLEQYIKLYPEVFELAEAFTDRITHYSTHASGVVISDVDLPEELPCRQDRKQKMLVTQVDMREVEDRGFPKFDILGVAKLDTLKLTTELAGVPDFSFRDINYNTMPDSYWRQVDKGHTLGFFQIEDGDAARRIGREMKPRTVLDLALIVALNRPGPLRSGDTERYLKRRKGEQDVTFLHPILEPILSDSLGIFAFQEEVIAYFNAIGYDLSEADHIRKIMGKKKVEDMQAEFEPYMARAINVMSEEKAGEIWESIVNFSKYGFNKSHAVGYGILLAWTMYAKWKWPTEFILASILTGADDERVARFVAEGRRMGINIQPPDINRSGVGVSTTKDEIFFGLSDIKGIGKLAARWIMNHRPYMSYEDFMETFNAAQDEWLDDKRGRSPKQLLRSNQIAALVNAGAFDKVTPRDLTLEERAEMEEELLGIALTDVVTPVIERNFSVIRDLASLTDLSERPDEIVPVPGVITSIKMSRVGPKAYKNPGEEFAWVSIEWEGEQATFAAFPEEYKRYKFMLKPRVVGRFDLKNGKRGPVLIKGIRLLS